MRKGRGGGTGGAWAAPAGVLGGRPLWEPLFLLLCLRGPHFPGRVGEPASERRAAGNGFREKGREEGILVGREGADLGGGWTIRNQGERTGRDPRRLDHCRREVARGIGARGPVGSGGSAGHTLSPCSPERSGARWG